VTDHPVLVPTSTGVIGGVVTTPAGMARTACVILPAPVGTRAGTNQVLARLARRLASMGALTFRADYAGVSESHAADRTARSQAVMEVTAWFAEQAGDLDHVVVGACGGMTATLDATDVLPRLVGVALLAPPLLAYQAMATAQGAEQGPDGSADLAETPRLAPAEVLANLARRAPVWTLMGGNDRSLPTLRSLEALLPSGHTVEVVDGAVLQGFPTAEAQKVTLDRAAAWYGRVAPAPVP
jgi:alpha/beta superfamily hydrolase